MIQVQLAIGLFLTKTYSTFKRRKRMGRKINHVKGRNLVSKSKVIKPTSHYRGNICS